jgi:hypothetical protein
MFESVSEQLTDRTWHILYIGAKYFLDGLGYGLLVGSVVGSYGTRRPTSRHTYFGTEANRALSHLFWDRGSTRVGYLVLYVLYDRYYVGGVSFWNSKRTPRSYIGYHVYHFCYNTQHPERTRRLLSNCLYHSKCFSTRGINGFSF